MDLDDRLNVSYGSQILGLSQSKERSYITSWGSFGLVQAQLELYEQLCRFGIWDFAINLSGADLPLRSVEDLSYTLAPYRDERRNFDFKLYFKALFNHLLTRINIKRVCSQKCQILVY